MNFGNDAEGQDVEEVDRQSFDDSDRFEEDSLCSYLSESESVCNHWRGWRKDEASSSTKNTPIRGSHAGNGIPSLVEYAARVVASTYSFETVDKHNPPVPEQLQKRIAFWSFPESEDDIRLYSCLANGNDEEFHKGEQLFRDNLVKNLLQIGLHLSGSVVPPRSLLTKAGNNNATTALPTVIAEFNVAITFDRLRVTSSSCTCKSAATKAWCSHVVAVCLHRIYRPESVELRAPLSESFSQLDHKQLWKFAQYFIDQLPRQVLPAAQQLLDELLNPSSQLNNTDQAPDPTCESSAEEPGSWCLDENALHENIRNLLVKFCIPSPMVCSDVNFLSSSAPPVANEWNHLLRPLRGREPEGMWNLLAIIREMFKRADNNALLMLQIVTDECLACEQVVVWWYTSRTPQGYANSVVARPGPGVSTTATQHASASLMDEVVALWKLAVLNPGNCDQDRNELEEQLQIYHTRCLDKVAKSRSQNQNGQNAQGNAQLKQADLDVFPGFKPAIEACQVDWIQPNSVSGSMRTPESLKSHRKLSHLTQDHPQPVIQGTHSVRLSLDSTPSTSSEGDVPLKSTIDENEEKLATYLDWKTGKAEIGGYLASMKRQDVLFMRAEAFYAHGYFKEAFALAVELTEDMLQNPPVLSLSDFDLRNPDGTLNIKQKRRFVHQLTHITSTILTKIAFLVKALLDSPVHHFTAFSIGLYGIEFPREPGTTKAMEVKISFQEFELLSLLKKIPVTSQILDIICQRAIALRDGQLTSRGDAFLPLNLASYIFETLCLPSAAYQPGTRKTKAHEELGFDAAVAALGLRSNISEADFPLVCEGTRRLRSDLAFVLMMTYKDDNGKLDRIMASLLDRRILEGSSGQIPEPVVKPFVRQNEVPQAAATTRVVRDLQQQSGPDRQVPLRVQESGDSSALEEDNKDWESKLRCTVFKTKHRRPEGAGNIDSSPPETTSSDNSPTFGRRQPRQKTNGTEYDNADSGSDSRDSSFRNDDYPVAGPSGIKQLIAPMEALARSSTPVASTSNGNRIGRLKGPKGRFPTEPNQPSEALAYSLFELAKLILAKAGGSVNTAQFQPRWGQNHSGPHRGLHFRAFQIGFYALGIENCINSNWQSRQYSTHGSWVEAQASEIGEDAFTFLTERWEGHFTPAEIALLADKVSRSSDIRMVRVAAELAKTVLPHAHALRREAIQRVLAQCKEQDFRMLEEALIAVEHAANGLGVFPLALFDVAHQWYVLFAESTGEALPQPQPEPAVFSNNPPEKQSAAFMGLQNALQLIPVVIPQPQRHHQGMMGNWAHHPHPYFPQQILAPQPIQNLPIPIPHMALGPVYNNYTPLQWGYLDSAYRVGMLAMEALGKRAQDDQRNRYAKNPPYAEAVRWLLGITLKIQSLNPGGPCLHRLIQSVHFVVTSPYILWEIAMEVAKYYAGPAAQNVTVVAIQLRMPYLSPLIHKCFQMFAVSIGQKLQGLTQNEEEDFLSTVCAANLVSCFCHNGPAAFHQLIHHDIRKSKFCKRDLWDKIIRAISMFAYEGSAS